MKGQDDTVTPAAANAELAQASNLVEKCPGNGRTLQEAIDELNREFNVRERCFPKWEKEGRITKSDAVDRLERMAAACYFLSALSCGDLASCMTALAAIPVPDTSSKPPF